MQKIRPMISWFDIGIIVLFLVGGIIYLHNVYYWGAGWVGHSQYGDAEFWWNGAIHFAEGLFQDNPGKGFRPGYFILTGLSLPLFGTQFKPFYYYFLFIFLSCSGLFYLTLRNLIGRMGAAVAVCLLIFNPFTAEWLATSTTDGTGLLLNMAALLCLLNGVKNNFRLTSLAAFGLLFSLATLTRPLVTPFIGLVLLSLLLYSGISLKHRLKAVFIIFIAFCIPTFAWMLVQKATIDRWAISSNDASALYGASDPKIQVWTPSMYDPIHAKAKEYFHVPDTKLTDQMIDKIFWQETIKNYLKYPSYHLKRIAPHFWEIAKFSPKRATHGTDKWRIAFLSLLSLFYGLRLFYNRHYLKGILFSTLTLGIYFYPAVITYMILFAAVVGLFQYKKSLGIFLVSLYWIVGVFALYLVGGTWGPPSFSALFDLNALGYRLGSQVFFVGDMLAVISLWMLAKTKPTETDNSAIYQPKPFLNKILVIFYSLVLGSVIIVYLSGTIAVLYRIYERHQSSVQQFPSLQTLNSVYKREAGKTLVPAQIEKGALKDITFDNKFIKNNQADVVFTGEISSFIWNLAGQSRTQLLVHTQNQLTPHTLGPGRIFLDVPAYLHLKQWIGRQGAFIIHKTADHHNESNQPYYLTNYALKAFIPLTADQKNYDLSKITWFPIQFNATQLESQHDLKFYEAKINWKMDSGIYPYKRRFLVLPQKNTVKMTLDFSHIKTPTNLRFMYEIADNQGQPLSSLNTEQIVIYAKSHENHPLYISHSQKGLAPSPQTVTIKIPKQTKNIEIVFNHISPNSGVWMYEFNVEARDAVNISN